MRQKSRARLLGTYHAESVAYDLSSDAVLFREIDQNRPTLLLDETDTLFCNGKDDRAQSLRALLNAGFERKARVPRCVGQGSSFAVQHFAVFVRKHLPVSVRCQTPYATAVF